MEKIDPDRERERLSKRYGAMSDLELQKVGHDPEALTEWARQAFKEEMEKRGLEWSPDAISAKAKAVLEEETLVPLRTYDNRTAALSDRSVLQSAGIGTLFYNENQASMGWGAAHNIEIRLMVRAKDVAAARQFLEQKSLLAAAQDSEQVTREVPGKPVVLRAYRDMPAAFVAKSMLHAARIRCFLQDANVVGMDWMWSNAVGGIKLVVGENDVEDAVRILNAKLDEFPADTER